MSQRTLSARLVFQSNTCNNDEHQTKLHPRGPSFTPADHACPRPHPFARGLRLAVLATAALVTIAAPITAQAAEKMPNILVIWGDDIGISNISAYSGGLMGYETPNIDRIGREGIRFLHYYAEQSCTAGRAAFCTGQHGIRSGMTKVGFPGAPMGMDQRDPSIGGLLKSLGYSTGQFGKNHLGDRNPS